MSSASWAQTSADMESARGLRKEARALKEAGDLKGAAAKYKAAHAYAKTAVTGIDLAEAYAAISLLVEARDLANAVVAMPVEADESALSVNARKQAAVLSESLKARLAGVSVVIEKIPSTSTLEPSVTIDGQVIPAAALGEARKVNPGSHQIVARFATKGEEKTVTVFLKEGETKSVSIRIHAPEQDEPAVGTLPPPKGVALPQPSKTGVSPLVYVGAGLGGVGLIVGGIFGYRAVTQKNALESDFCPAGKTQCKSGYADELSHAKSSGTISTVGFVAGGVGLGLMVTGLVLGGSKTETRTTGASVTPWFAPNGGGLSGAF
jgi:hypothetical protein